MSAHAVDQVEARIAELVEARRPQLAELVRRAVDLELERLVDVELAGRNGVDVHRDRDAVLRDREVLHQATLRRCRHCNESKPLDQFGQHRHVCRTCRADQQARARERRTQPAEQGDAPRPGTTST